MNPACMDAIIELFEDNVHTNQRAGFGSIVGGNDLNLYFMR